MPPNLSTVPVVYIAAPYSHPEPVGRALNVERARLLARLAVLEGLSPVLAHPLIDVGVFGDDANPQHRAFGLEADKAVVQAIAMTTNGCIWVLRNDDGDWSPGVDVERSTWIRMRHGLRGLREGSWATWLTLAICRGLGAQWDAHRHLHAREMFAVDPDGEEGQERIFRAPEKPTASHSEGQSLRFPKEETADIHDAWAASTRAEAERRRKGQA